MSNLKVGALCLTVLTLVGCATENSKVITPTSTQAATTASQYKGVKSVISVGKFDNKSSFQNGVFSDGQPIKNNFNLSFATNWSFFCG